MKPKWGRQLETAVTVLCLANAAAIVGMDSIEIVSFWIPMVLLAAVALWIAQQDLRTFTIPDGALIGMSALGFAYRIADGSSASEPITGIVFLIVVDVAVSGGGLLAVRELYFRYRGSDGLGFGDVKLAAAGGILVGAIGFSWALFGASLGAICLVLIVRLYHRESRAPDKLAFGAILAPALWIAWVLAYLPWITPADQ